MAKHTNLSSLFKGIADAIRSKTGKTDKIVADDFPAAIEGISTGHPNGMEWTKTNLPEDYYYTIKYHDGVWLAAGSNGEIYYSANGKVWSKSDYPHRLCDLSYLDGTWVVTSQNSADGLYYSTNGVNWYVCDIGGATLYNLQCVGGVLFGFTGSRTNIYVSLNGKEWKQANLEGELNNFDIKVGNGIWLAMSDGIIYYSADATTWFQSDLPMDRYAVIVYGGGVWIAGLKDGIYRSIDGKSWIKVNMGPVSSVTYGCGTWVCTGEDSNSKKLLYYSLDAGITWIEWDVHETDLWFNQSYYDHGVWLVPTTKGVYYSTDGATWCLSDNPDKPYGHPIYVNGIWYLRGTSYYSRDGINWSKTNLILYQDAPLYSHNGIWIAGSEGMYYSFDGITWHTAPPLDGNKIGASQYIVSNANGIWLASPDTGKPIYQGLYYSVGWEPPSTN